MDACGEDSGRRDVVLLLSHRLNPVCVNDSKEVNVSLSRVLFPDGGGGRGGKESRRSATRTQNIYSSQMMD